MARKIEVVVHETNHPDVPPYKASVLVDSVEIGFGEIDKCHALAEELKKYPGETEDIYKSFKEEGNQDNAQV